MARAMVLTVITIQDCLLWTVNAVLGRQLWAESRNFALAGRGAETHGLGGSGIDVRGHVVMAR